MDEKRYEEAGTNYRFFLNWRQIAFAGYLAVLYGVLSLTVVALEKAPSFAWIIPLFASPIGIILWILDCRTRDLYHAAIRAGRDLEGEEKGFYTHLAERAVVPPGTSAFSRMTHSGALNLSFIGGSIVLALLSAVLLVKHLW